MSPVIIQAAAFSSSVIGLANEDAAFHRLEHLEIGKRRFGAFGIIAS